jgi:hypothetical protein
METNMQDQNDLYLRSMFQTSDEVDGLMPAEPFVTGVMAQISAEQARSEAFSSAARLVILTFILGLTAYLLPIAWPLFERALTSTAQPFGLSGQSILFGVALVLGLGGWSLATRN